MVRSWSLPPEDGWFDPRTLNEDTEPPATARLDAEVVDPSEVDFSEDGYAPTMELEFTPDMLTAMSDAPPLHLDEPLQPEVSGPPPLPIEASVPPPLPVATAEIPQWSPSARAQPPRVSEPPAIVKPPLVSQRPLVSQPPMVSRPPSLRPHLTGVPSSPWLVVHNDQNLSPVELAPVHEIRDEPSSETRISSVGVFVSQRPGAPAPAPTARRRRGLRYAAAGIAAAAAIAGVAVGWQRHSSEAPRTAQAAFSNVAPGEVVVATPTPAETAAPIACAPVEVQSLAPGYRVYIDGKAKGPAPGTFELPCGEHTVALMSPSRGVISKTLRRVEVGPKATLIRYTWVDIASR